jgi:hypothetical protein
MGNFYSLLRFIGLLSPNFAAPNYSAIAHWTGKIKFNDSEVLVENIIICVVGLHLHLWFLRKSAPFGR